MLSLFTNLLTLPSATYELFALSSATTKPAFKMKDYFPRQIAQNAPEVNALPVCTLSGRVVINTTSSTQGKTQWTDEFRRFIGNTHPQMSVNEPLIAQLVEQVRSGQYTAKILFDQELPYLALAAFANNQLSIWEVANLLIWHQMAKEQPDLEPTITPLFDDKGNWNKDALSYFQDYSTSDEEFEAMRILIRQLPVSQQVYLKFNDDVEGWFKQQCRSLETERVYLSVHRSHFGDNPYFAQEPRLGIISKEELVNVLLNDRRRLLAIPFPDIPTHQTNEGPIHFVNHDMGHSYMLNYAHASTIDSFRELLTTYREMTGEIVTAEIWRIADFEFPPWTDLSLKDRNADFNNAVESSCTRYGVDITNSLWIWHMVLRIHDQAERWAEQYGISLDQVPILATQTRLVKLADPFLKQRPIREKIYLLQELTKTGMTDETQINDFFQTHRVVPPLTIAVTKHKWAAVLSLTVR